MPTIMGKTRLPCVQAWLFGKIIEGVNLHLVSRYFRTALSLWVPPRQLNYFSKGVTKPRSFWGVTIILFSFLAKVTRNLINLKFKF